MKAQQTIPGALILCAGILLSALTPRAGLAAAPSADQTLYQEALQDMQAGKDADAIPKLTGIVDRNPRNMSAWEHLGWCHWRLGHPDETRRIWTRLVTVDPSNPAPYKLLAKLAIQENRIEDAQKLFRKSLDLDPNQPDVAYHLGRTFRWEGRNEKALALLEQLLRENPDRTDVHLEIARAKMSQWDFSGALPHWTRLCEAAASNADNQASRAYCLLHTNQKDEAVALARSILLTHPTQITALNTLADAYEMDATPEDALPWLEQWLAAVTDPIEQERVRVRLLRLTIRLYKRQPRVRTLTRPIELCQDRLKAFPNSVDAHLLMGELMLMQQRFAEAERYFQIVLKDFNPENRRAFRGLFETYAASKRYDDALKALDAVTAFNPRDPYLDYYRARFEAARGDFYKAAQALNRLEAAGLQGSVAVLLYHGLVESDYFVDALSTRRFREHLEALQEAGFTIVRVPDLPSILSSPDRKIQAGTDGSRILVAVDFDDARRDSMRFATPIARDLQIPLSMNVPVGYIERNNPFICSWEELRHYKTSGVWTFGSHFLDGAILTALDAKGTQGRPMPNRIWRSDLKRMETPEERTARVREEFQGSREVLEQQLGGPVINVAYPFGDIGQEDFLNAPGAYSLLQELSAETFEAGFIQSEFGYAVATDNPNLYQRHEIPRWDGGPAVVEHLYQSHPVFLARTVRTEFAALTGKRHEARRNLQLLETNHYPAALLEPARDYVQHHMARKFASPGADQLDNSRSFFEVRPDKPFIGGQALFFEDNQGRRNWEALGKGGLHLTPYFSLEGKAGIGNYHQDPAKTGGTGPALDFDERVIGASLNLLLPTGGFLTGDVLQRTFDPSADSLLAGAVEGHFRPFYYGDLLLRGERDIVPSAQAIASNITYNALMALGIVSATDAWDLSAAGSLYDFSDGNSRDQIELGSTWLVSERDGLKLGLRYQYTTSDHDSTAYWTPYHLQRGFVEGGFQGHYNRHYYNLRLRFGMGREELSPDELEARREFEARAAREDFDPGPPPEEPGWEPVYGVAASTRLRFGEHWELHGEVSYNHVPDYNELTVLGDLRYSF